MKNFILILLTFITLLSYGQGRDVYTTTSAGSWVNALNWDLGVAPDNDQTDGSDDIIITHHITLTDDLSVKSGTNITVTGCDTLYVTGNVTFNNGSSITVDSCAFLIIDGNVTNNNNSTNVVINGTISIGGDYDGGNGSELTGDGEMEVDGTVTTDGTGTVFGSDSDCTVDGTCDNTSDCNLDCGVLPIKLLDFNCYNDVNNIILEWSTASEINNEYFQLYKSYDGYEWFIVGIVNGSGNSSTTQYYSYYDIGDTKDDNYYKLRQIDFNGNFSESNIVHCNKSPKTIVSIEIYDIFGRRIDYLNQSGILIIIQKYKDGTITREKIYK